jgi:uncharacterized protein (DUF433 family)
MGQIVNVSHQENQLSLDFYLMHLERVETNSKGLFKFFPFVVEPRPSEPKIIEIDPMVGFGKPVIAGTDISTAIIASRFNARESITSLAEEYGCMRSKSKKPFAGSELSLSPSQPDDFILYLDESL